MNRRLIAALTGLALLAQGFGMAWAAPHLAQPAAPDTAATAQMPCHGDAADGQDADAAETCACCNGGCMFACGGAPLPAALSAGPAPAPDPVFFAARVTAPLASHSLSPFRPPAA